MGNTVSTDALRPELWEKELYLDVIDNMYFTQGGMMGEDDNNIVQIKNDLKKNHGDRINFGLTAKLTGSGVTGDNELEGNEEVQTPYAETLSIDQIRNAIRLTGKYDEQINMFNMRKEAKRALSVWMQEFIEKQIFFKLGGVVNASLDDIFGTEYSARCQWSNTPDYVPDADTASAAGSRYRYVCADVDGTVSLATTDVLTPALIDQCRTKAMLANPKVRPLRVNGRNYWVMFIHPYQLYDLRQNAVWAQAQREADKRGPENKIFSGAAGIWNGVIIKEHEYVPFLDQSADYSFRAAAAGSNATADVLRALFCGRQAVGFAKCKSDGKGWVEETFDYKNKVGFATTLIGGIQKLMFNSKEYGVIACDTSSSQVS